MDTKDKPKRTIIDWDAMEPHYRSGIRPLKELGAEYGCTDAAIIKHAKNFGWTRNMRARIQQRAADKVSAAMLVSAEVSAQTKITQEMRIEVEAEVQARVEMAHRTDVPRARKRLMGFFDELDHQCENQEQYERLGELMEAKDDKGVDKLNEAYRRVIGFSGRVDNVKKLIDALKVAVDLDRRVFRIDDVAEGTGSADDLIAYLKRGAAGG